MKKIFASIIFTLFIAKIFAQGFSGGLFIGPTVSWIKTDSPILTAESAKLGYTFGITADFGLTENFAFYTGVRFNNIGGSKSFNHGAMNIKVVDGDLIDGLNDFIDSKGKVDFDLNYVAVPLGFKGMTNEIGYITYFLKAGVTPMINIKPTANIGSHSNLIIKDHVKMFNLGWNIGAGIEYSLSGSTRLLVDVMYTGGLTDFSTFDAYTNEDKDATREQKATLNDIHLKVGILF